LLVTTLAGTGLLALSGWFITATAAAAAATTASVVAFGVYIPGGAIRAFALGRTAARYGERVYNHDVVLRLLADLRTAVFARLSRLDALTLGRLRSTDVLSRLTADIDALDALYLRVLAPPLVALLAIAAIAGLTAWFAPLLGFGVAVWLLGVWLALIAGGWLAGVAPSERVSAATEGLRGRVLEQVEGLAELLCFRTLDRHRQATHQQQRQRAVDQRRLAGRHAAGEALATMGVQGAGVLALLGGAVLVQQADLPVAVAVLMALAPLGLGELLGALPGGFIQLGRSRAAARRVNAQVQVRTGVVDPDEPQPVPPSAALTFEQVHYRYTRYDPVLAGLSLAVSEGERVAVLGRSGAGKSTLGALALRRIDPDGGTVRLGGAPLDTLAMAAVRSRVGYLTQDTALLDASLASNLRIADPGADDAALQRALAVAGLDGFVQELPRGLATGIGQSGARLSGGQARRLSLARVILRAPSVVVLDEPLAGLDAETAEAVAANLDAWLAGRTVLMLGHDAAALPRADRHVRLADGVIRNA
jgi:ATP-binding cassette subfamily C protein CydC